MACVGEVTPFIRVRGVLLPLLAAEGCAGSATEDGSEEGCKLEAALSCRAVGAAKGLPLGEAVPEVEAGSCLLSCLLARLNTNATQQADMCSVKTMLHCAYTTDSIESTLG